MFTGLVLVALAVACRLISHDLALWNFVPVGAVAIYAGARMSWRWAWLVPLAAMGISDAFIHFAGSYPITSLERWTVYGSFAALTLLGPLARRPGFRLWMAPGLGLAGSTLFFATTNFGVWAEGQLYPMNLAGLVDCYIKAIPFYQNTLVADLLGTCVLFGVGPVIERAVSRAWSTAAPDAEAPVEVADLA